MPGDAAAEQCDHTDQFLRFADGDDAVLEIDGKPVKTRACHDLGDPGMRERNPRSQRDLVGSEFMLECPVVAMVLQGENAVSRVRELIGPTDRTKAPKGRIRGDWGESVQKNLVHASDAPERAEFEIGLLFKPTEVYS